MRKRKRMRDKNESQVASCQLLNQWPGRTTKETWVRVRVKKEEEEENSHREKERENENGKSDE